MAVQDIEWDLLEHQIVGANGVQWSASQLGE